MHIAKEIANFTTINVFLDKRVTHYKKQTKRQTQNSLQEPGIETGSRTAVASVTTRPASQLKILIEVELFTIQLFQRNV